MNGPESTSRRRLPLAARQTRWMMHMRWIAGAALIVAGLVDRAWLGIGSAGSHIALLGAAVLALNSAYWMVCGRSPSLWNDRRRRDNFAMGQIAIDLVCITLLTAWTGGIASPAVDLFTLHMVFAGLLQPRGRAWMLGGLAVGLFLGSLLAAHRWPSDAPSGLQLLGWVVSLCGTIYLTVRIAGALYRREQARIRHARELRRVTARLKSQQAAMLQHEKMVAMGRMAAGLAHEVRNPLANIDSLLQLMQRNPGTARPDAITSMREQVKRIEGVVRELTAYAHPDTGRAEGADINALVRSSMDLMRFDHRIRKVHVEMDLAPDAGQAPVFVQAMQQVLVNLVVNALDATRDVPAGRLQLRTRRAPGGCLIEVEDNGSGIAPEHLDQVFEPFFTTKPVGEGTGLGLSISLRLIRQHGGTLEVFSQPGHGSRFRIFLPARHTVTVQGAAAPVLQPTRFPEI